jgi:hypothetical protein
VTAPVLHPRWCDEAHGESFPHSGQVGADIDLTAELAIGVFLFQSGGEPAVVNLMSHTPDETSFTKYSLLQAAALRDLISEALGLVAREAGLA